MLRPKKSSYKEFDDEKNCCGSKMPHPPPLTFLMVHPLKSWWGQPYLSGAFFEEFICYSYINLFFVS